MLDDFIKQEALSVLLTTGCTALAGLSNHLLLKYFYAKEKFTSEEVANNLAFVEKDFGFRCYFGAVAGSVISYSLGLPVGPVTFATGAVLGISAASCIEVLDDKVASGTNPGDFAQRITEERLERANRRTNELAIGG